MTNIHLLDLQVDLTPTGDIVLDHATIPNNSLTALKGEFRDKGQILPLLHDLIQVIDKHVKDLYTDMEGVLHKVDPDLI